MSRSLSTLKIRLRKILIQLTILGLGALVVGILSNQFHSQGIKWKILQLSVPTLSGQSQWTYVSVDSAFFLFLQQEDEFIDIRIRDDFEIDHIPNAHSLPFFEFFDTPQKFSQQDKSTTYILYDLERNSKTVRLMARQLIKESFDSVYVMRGGFVEWLDKTYPVEGGTN